VTPRFIPALFAVSALALGMAACSEPSTPAAQATDVADVAPASTPVDVMPQADDGAKNYVEKAALTDMFEIESSRIALERSKVQPVKDFAQMMIDNHTKTSVEVMPLATSAGVAPPTALDADHMKKLDDLRNAKDQDFDDVYIDQQTEAHENALSLHKDFANNGRDAGLQQFAAKTAPVVDAHLVMIKALDKSPADDVTKPTN